MKSTHSLKTVHLRPRLSAEHIGVMEENGSWRRTENEHRYCRGLREERCKVETEEEEECGAREREEPEAAWD